MRIENDVKLDFKDVLIRPKRSSLISRSEVSLVREFKLRHSNETWTGIPILAANMDGVGTLEMTEALSPLGLTTALHKFYDIDTLAPWMKKGWYKFRYFYTLGASRSELDKAIILTSKLGEGFSPPLICLDVANGYTESFVSFVQEVRETFPQAIIMAGNVVTGEMTEELILNGADIVKVGLGSGSACLTRSVTGVGYPQLSAIIECADAAHGLGGLICSDGGCRTSGDIAKAFGGGADFVMLGGILAGHDESGTQEFYGMSSEMAMKKHYGKMAEYRASEGAVMTLESRGPVKNTIQSILGGLRSACTYVGASSLKELSKRTTFVRVNAG